MTTATWTAMKLCLAPNSLKVGCGHTSNCLLALDKYPSGKATERCTQKIHSNIHVTTWIQNLSSPLWVLMLFFLSVTPHHLLKMFLCKTQLQPGSSLALVCQEPMVRIHWLKSVLCFTCTCLILILSVLKAFFFFNFLHSVTCFLYPSHFKVSVWVIH